MTTLARAERHRLCDLALETGPDAPTLCDGWTVKDLVVHLLVREHSPIGAPGILVPALSGLTDRSSSRLARREFPDLVDRLRHPRFALANLPGVDRLMNTGEFFVHHEDVRRARPSWEPRALDPAETHQLWQLVTRTGRLLARPAGVPLLVENRATGATALLRRGDDPVRLVGDPAEVLLFLFGRAAVTGLEFDGRAEAVSRLQRASLGF